MSDKKQINNETPGEVVVVVPSQLDKQDGDVSLLQPLVFKSPTKDVLKEDFLKVKINTEIRCGKYIDSKVGIIPIDVMENFLESDEYKKSLENNSIPFNFVDTDNEQLEDVKVNLGDVVSISLDEKNYIILEVRFFSEKTYNTYKRMTCALNGSICSFRFGLNYENSSNSYYYTKLSKIVNFTEFVIRKDLHSSLQMLKFIFGELPKTTLMQHTNDHELNNKIKEFSEYLSNRMSR